MCERERGVVCVRERKGCDVCEREKGMCVRLYVHLCTVESPKPG